MANGVLNKLSMWKILSGLYPYLISGKSSAMCEFREDLLRCNSTKKGSEIREFQDLLKHLNLMLEQSLCSMCSESAYKNKLF